MNMEDDIELEPAPAHLRLVDSFDRRDPAETVKAVAAALEFWNSLILRDLPDNISQLVLRESGRAMVHAEVAKLAACLNRAAQEIEDLRSRTDLDGSRQPPEKTRNPIGHVSRRTEILGAVTSLGVPLGLSI